MKRRPRRATIGAVALGTSLVAILAVAYRDTVRDHVEAWHFQLTRETETFDPFRVEPARLNEEGVLVCPSPGLQILSTHARRSIIFDPTETQDVPLWRVTRELSAEEVVRILGEDGHRVLEQRFPRRAYVVIRSGDEEPYRQGVLRGGVRLSPDE